ncbi:hypothetical protein JCM8097_004855 [Rhodosporidiobolus ruineniae]
MSSMRKTVELATKPKRAAPKAKYIDPIVQATFSQDGALQEIVRTLSVRMRDSNPVIVFKSLIVLHTMTRSGSLDAVFSYLSSSSATLSLSSHEAANISAYGHYLAARIKAYGNLKRDVIRDKSDRRAANRLRNLGVEQGLLRETREIQRMIAALVEAKFYADDVDDDLSMTALRLLVKDLLVLFQAVNEGVINVLENFFGMSSTDAQTALKIYKTFCRDTEKVVAYLGTAKKLYNVLNIPIPNLKHAPVSLAKSLEEYLNDPNFEQNRQEYRENKRIADGGAPRTTTPKPATSAPAASSSSAAQSSSSAPATSQPASSAQPKSFTDFFESIEQAQTPMFNPNTGSPTLGYFQQQAAFNPFMVAPQPTGMPFAQPGLMPQMTGFGGVAPNPFLQPQVTGFIQPQMTGFGGQPQLQQMQMQPQMTGMAGANPFRQSMMPQMTGLGAPNPFMQQQQPQMTGFSAPPPVPSIQPQATGSPFGQPQQQQQQQSGFLQSQPTGNPFGAARPVSLMPQATGNPFQQRPQSMAPFSPSPSMGTVPASPGAPSGLGAPAGSLAPFGSPSPSSSASAPPPVPSSAAAPTPAPLTAQKTGTRNPFAPAPGTIITQTQPVQPKGPSMFELAAQRQQAQLTGFGAQGQVQPQQTGFANGAAGGQQQQPAKQDAFSAFLAQQEAERQQQAQQQQNGGAPAPLIAQKTGGLMASIASDLAFSRENNTSSPNAFGSATSQAPFSSSTFSTGSTSLSTPFSSLSLGGTGTSSALSPSTTGGSGAGASFLQPQTTGFASSVKPFQPTSSFGSQLATEFGGPSSSASASALSAQPPGFQPSSTSVTGAGAGGFSSSFAPSPSPAFAPPSASSSSPAPLRPQTTGYNPFSGTKLPPLNTPLSAGLTAQPTGTGVSAFRPTSAFGQQMTGTGGGAAAGGGAATGSLI